ncbi:MAG: hypothetical protein ACFHX7_08025 [Pseudomonadota bacterium]
MNTQLPIHDESHARAILRGELRRARANMDAAFAQAASNGGKMSRRGRAEMVKAYRAGLGDLVITHIVVKPKRHSHNAAHYFLNLEFDAEDAKAPYPVNDIVPIAMTRMNTKQPWKPSSFDLCHVTEHLLERLVLRQQCHSLREVTVHLVALALSTMHLRLNPDQGFENSILLTTRGYFALRQDASLPVVLSWIPADRYTPRQAAKITSLAATLGDDSVVIEADIFNDAVFLDAFRIDHDPGFIRIPGGGIHFADGDEIREIVVSADRLNCAKTAGS